MAEQKESKERESKPAASKEEAHEGIEYIDYGDYTLEIDSRGPVQQRRKLPKSTRGIGVAAATRRELEARIQQEVIEPQKVWEEVQTRDESLLPPEEDDEAVEKREKENREKLDKIEEEQRQQQEEAQQEVRG